MKLKSLLARLGVVFVAAAVIACGGGGGPAGGGSPTETTREAVRLHRTQGLAALAMSGAVTPEQASVINGSGASTGGTTGGSGHGIPMIGSFLRYGLPGFGGGISEGSRARRTREAGNSLFFDEFLGLWVESTESEAQYRVLLFEDEAKTKPAGQLTVSWSNDDYAFNSTYEITAGAFVGSHGFYESEWNEDGTGGMRYEDHSPQWGDSRGSSTFGSDGTYSWSSQTSTKDGAWYRDRGTFRADGRGETLSESSAGYRITNRYNADGSGNGAIQGPDPGLPATIVWESNGRTTITYADGTVEVIPGWEDLGGGTTGSGTGGDDGGSVPPSGGESGSTGSR